MTTTTTPTGTITDTQGTIVTTPVVKNSTRTLWVVKLDGEAVGLVEKIRDDRSTVSPYRAFRGVGETAELVGFYWAVNRLPERVANSLVLDSPQDQDHHLLSSSTKARLAAAQAAAGVTR